MLRSWQALILGCLLLKLPLLLSGIAESSGGALESRRGKAIGGTEQLQSLSPGVWKQLNRAQELIAAGSNQMAESLLDELLSSAGVRQRTVALAQLLRAQLLTAVGQQQQALHALQAGFLTGQLSQPQAYEVTVRMAYLHMGSRDYEAAARLFQDLLVTGNQPPAYLYASLAQCYAQLKLYEAAANQLDKAISGKANPPVNWLSLAAAVAWHLKKYDKAADWTMEILEREPLSRQRWQQLAAIWEQSGNHIGAAGVYGVLKGWPGTQERWFPDSRASMLEQSGAPLLAAQAWLAALNGESGLAKARDFLKISALMVAAKESEMAVQMLLQALAQHDSVLTDADSVLLWRQLAHLHAERKEWSQAAEALERAARQEKVGGAGQLFMRAGEVWQLAQLPARARLAYEAASVDPQVADEAKQRLAGLRSSGMKRGL